jgi:hypothetical protein
VVALNNVENQSTRQNITLLISNLLMPATIRGSDLNPIDDDEKSKVNGDAKDNH